MVKSAHEIGFGVDVGVNNTHDLQKLPLRLPPHQHSTVTSQSRKWAIRICRVRLIHVEAVEKWEQMYMIRKPEVVRRIGPSLNWNTPVFRNASENMLWRCSWDHTLRMRWTGPFYVLNTGISTRSEYSSYGLGNYFTTSNLNTSYEINGRTAASQIPMLPVDLFLLYNLRQRSHFSALAVFSLSFRRTTSRTNSFKVRRVQATESHQLKWLDKGCVAAVSPLSRSTGWWCWKIYGMTRYARELPVMESGCKLEFRISPIMT